MRREGTYREEENKEKEERREGIMQAETHQCSHIITPRQPTQQKLQPQPQKLQLANESFTRSLILPTLAY